MANLVELLDKSPIIKTKIESIVKEIKLDIENGNIPNKTQAFIRFKNDVELFIKRLIGITYEVREANISASSEDINEMIDELHDDFSFIYESINNIDDVLNICTSQSELEKQMIININKNINMRVEELNNNLLDIISDNETKIYFEDFINNDNFNIDLCKTPATLLDGVLTLNLINSYGTLDSDVEICSDSNGLPGNTHIAVASGEQIRYEGEIEAHIDLNYLYDREIDTWFEYEIFNIDDRVWKETNGHGFTYEEGLSWITDDEYLLLKLKSTMEDVGLQNMLYINPYLPVERSYIPSSITSIKLYDGSGNVKEILDSEIIFNKEVVINFELQYVKEIEITFLQNKKYKTMVGHNCFVKSGINNNILNNNILEGVRVEGEKHSIKSLGLSFDTAKHSFIQPNTRSYKVSNTNKLFEIPEAKEYSQSYAELIEAERYQIGIRDIDQYLKEFRTEGEYISKEFKFENGISQIELHVEDSVPSIYTNSISNYIKYYISADNGANWNIITPYRKDEEGGVFYTLAEFNKETVDGLILKIEMTADEEIDNSNFYSPIIYNYNLIGRK
jgi:hypothetical protein